MTDVACFCGCLYSFDGAVGPCPECGAVAGVSTTAIRQASHDREQGQPVEAGASQPARTPPPIAGVMALLLAAGSRDGVS
jgi:hypothetical protein